MEIQLNGEPYALEDGANVARLLQALELQGKRVAVEVNRDIVPRGEHATHCLQAGDKVEVVHAIGGGAGGVRQPYIAGARRVCPAHHCAVC